MQLVSGYSTLSTTKLVIGSPPNATPVLFPYEIQLFLTDSVRVPLLFQRLSASTPKNTASAHLTPTLTKNTLSIPIHTALMQSMEINPPHRTATIAPS